MIDPELTIPLDKKIIQTAHEQQTILVIDEKINNERLKPYQALGVTFIKKQTHPLDLDDLMITLGEMKIDGILIEGGSHLHGTALLSGIVDKAYVFIAPKMVGGHQALTPVGAQGIEFMKDAKELKNITLKSFDDDLMIEGYFK